MDGTRCSGEAANAGKKNGGILPPPHLHVLETLLSVQEKALADTLGAESLAGHDGKNIE